MTVTERDVELFAARIRLHFPPPLRDTAYEFAYSLARLVGAKVKLLSPETTLAEILGWVRPGVPFPSDSLDQVEWVMALEEEIGPGFVLPDELAAHTERTTFAQLVEHVAKKRNAG